MRAGGSLSITNTTTQQVPRLPFLKMKDTVLGKRYDLGLIFIGERRARSLNQTYRKKTYTPNVLAFPLSKHTGEVFICPHVAAREAKRYGIRKRHYIAYLFIHALLHLKGLSHGATMERKEQALLRTFGIVGRNL